MRTPFWVCLLIATSTGCARGAAPPQPRPDPSVTTQPQPRAIVETHTLAYVGSTPIGSERSHDDGDVLSSVVNVDGKEHTVSITRSKRTASCDDRSAGRKCAELARVAVWRAHSGVHP